mgnify:CR=1 FL=1
MDTREPKPQRRPSKARALAWAALAVGLGLVMASVASGPADAVTPAAQHEWSAEEQQFYHRYTASPHDAAQRLKRRYEGLEERIRRMEDVVTSREYDWERRLRT